MPQIEEGFKISFTGDAGSLEDASQAAAASIGNVLKAAARVSQLDSFKALSQSASKAVTNINAITGDLQKIRIDYTLPNFAPLQRLILSVKGDMNKAFLSVIPQPDTNPFTRAIAAMVTSAERNLETLRNTRVNMGAVQPPDLTLLKKAVEVARNELSKTALVSFPPPPKVDPIVIPAADTTRFTQSIRTVQTTAERVNTLLHSFESVKVPAIQPPSLTALENVVRDARANIDKTFLAPIPTQPFVNLSKEVQGIITGLKAQKIQVPFAIQQPDLSNIRTGVENAKKSIQDSLNIKIPAPTVQPIPAPKTTGYTTAVQGAIKLINELNSAAGNVTTAVKPPDLTGYKAAITAVRNDLQTATLVKVPPVDAKDFNASISPLQKAVAQVRQSLDSLQGQPIPTPAVLPPDLRTLEAAVQTAKQQIESVGRFRMPQIQVEPVPPLDYRAFDASANVISSKVQQVNKLFTAVSDTPINAPVLVPFDTKPLQKAVDVSKKLLSETAGLALPFIETPDVKPLNTAPYLNSLSTLQQSTLAAQKVITGISTIDVPAPVIQPPSLAPLFNAVATAKKTLSSIELELPKVTVRPIEAIAAPKIDTSDFVSSASDLQARVRQINATLKGVSQSDIAAPTLLPLDTGRLFAAVRDVKEQIAAVKFAQIQMPKIEPLAVPPVDRSAYDASLTNLSASVQMANRILSEVTDKPIAAPALLPPDLQPLRRAIQQAKQDVESVRLIEMPSLALPTVRPLDARLFDSSVVDIRTKIQNINALFGTVSHTPINAPALIPFDVTPLQNAVAAAKREINTAANLKLPTLAVPKIPGLNTTEFEKSVGLLQKRVELANTYLTDYGKTVIPTPVLPTPNLQPLRNAIETAKRDIANAAAIKLPAVSMPLLEPVKIPPVDTASFNKSVTDLQARVASINTMLGTVSTAPINVPTLQALNIAPLVNAVAEVKKQIAAVRFNEIQLPTVERVIVPPVDTKDFNASISALQARVNQVNTLLTGIDTDTISIPAIVAPDISNLKRIVAQARESIQTLSDLPPQQVQAPTLQPINTKPFDLSAQSIQTRVAQVNEAVARMGAQSIQAPSILAPNLSALIDVVNKTKAQIANSAAIQLPRIETPVIPAIDQKQFNTSFVDVRTRIEAVNALFESIDAKPIAAPLVAAPDYANLISATAKAKANVDATFLEPIPLTAFTNAAQQIAAEIKSLNASAADLQLPVPSDAALMSISKDARQKLEALWSAPIKAPVLGTPVIPALPAIPALPLPPLDTTNYLNAVKETIDSIRKDAAQGFTFELISDPNTMFADIRHLIDKIEKEKVQIPVTVENANTKNVTGPLKEIKNVVNDINDTPVNVEVGGSLKSIATLEKELTDLRESLRNATSLGDIAKFNNAIAVTQGKINQLQSIRDPFQKFKTTVASAGNSVMNFGRVVQDLPFAFQNFGAIANNIDPLFESFSRLRAEAKATGTSLVSNLVGALSGGAGIGLAISAVTSLVTAFSIGLFDNKKAVEEDTSALDALNDRLGDSKEAFEGVMATIAQMNRLGAINIEIAGQSKVLDLQGQSVLNREAIVKSQEREAQLWDEMTKAQAAYNAQTTTTDWRGVTTAVEPAKQYTDAVNAASKALKEQQGETLKLQDAQSILYREIALQRVQDAKKAAEAAQKNLPKPEFGFFDKFFDFSPNSLSLTQKQVRGLLDAAIAFRKEFGSGNGLRVDIPDFEIMRPDKGLQAAREYWLNFQKGIVRFKPGKFDVDFSVVPKVIDEDPRIAENFLESYRQQFTKNQKPIDIPFGIVPKLNAKSAEIKTFTEQGKQIGSTFGEAGGEAFAKIFQDAINNASIGAAALTDVAQSIKENFTAGAQLSTQFFSGIVQGAGSFTQALIDGQSGIQAFGDVMQQTLKKIIIQLAEAAALAAILSAITGGAAGGGLSFLGQFRKILGGGNLPGFAKGGFVVPAGFPNDGYNARLQSGEMVLPLNKMTDLLAPRQEPQVIVVHERLRGNDVVRQIARTQRSQNRTI